MIFIRNTESTNEKNTSNMQKQSTIEGSIWQNMNKPKTWKQLEAEGVKRCCAVFKDNTQCRRRASEKYDFSWCEKHGPTMKAWDKFNLDLIELKHQ